MSFAKKLIKIAIALSIVVVVVVEASAVMDENGREATQRSLLKPGTAVLTQNGQMNEYTNKQRRMKRKRLRGCHPKDQKAKGPKRGPKGSYECQNLALDQEDLALPVIRVPIGAARTPQSKSPMSTTPRVRSMSSAPEVNVSSAPVVNASSAPEVNVSSAPVVNASNDPEVNVSSAPVVTMTSAPEVNVSSAPVVNESNDPARNAPVFESSSISILNSTILTMAPNFSKALLTQVPTAQSPIIA
jgi:hypothetical protein